MLKHQFFSKTILILLILGIIIHGTNAHENPVIGKHGEISSGYAWAIVYKFSDAPVIWRSFASSSVSAENDPDPDIIIDGMFIIRAFAGQFNCEMPPDQKGGYFVGSLYKYVSNSANQSNSPTGLWAQGDGDAHSWQYDIMQFLDSDTNEVIKVWVRKYHDEHDPPWLDFAPEVGFLDAKAGKN